MKLAEVASLIPIILVLQWKIIMLIAFPKIEVFFQDTNYNFFLSLLFKAIHYWESSKENTLGQNWYFCSID